MQMKKVVLFLVVVFSVIFSSNAQVNVANIGSTLTIQQCVDIAIKSNLLVRQSDPDNAVKRRYLYNQAIDNLLHLSFNGNASQGINFGKSVNPYTNQYINEQINTGNYGLSAGLVLFSGLSYQSLIPAK